MGIDASSASTHIHDFAVLKTQVVVEVNPNEGAISIGMSVGDGYG